MQILNRSFYVALRPFFALSCQKENIMLFCLGVADGFSKYGSLSRQFIWRGGRAVECTGLENRRTFTGPASSNLALSAA